MHVMTDCAATLGSRFNLIFDPHACCLLQNAWGEFRERPLRLTAGVRTPEGRLWRLPFGVKAYVFPYLEQFSTLTTIEYRGVHPDLWFEFSMKVRSPFYPQDVRLSTAPFYYVDLTVKPLQKWRWKGCEAPLRRGELVFMLEGAGVEFEQLEDGFAYSFPSTSTMPSGTPDNPNSVTSKTVPVRSCVRCADGQTRAASAVGKAFDMAEGEQATLSLLWSSWTSEPVLEVRGEQTPFKYHQFFESEEHMAAWGWEQREDIEARCDFVDGLFRDWSLGRATSNLSALALHSFLANTWWTGREGGKDWFSVWEGSCFLHSPIGVEYNQALVYFALWPQLLDMLLEQWADFEVDARQGYGAQWKEASFLCHDMGASHAVGLRASSRHMEVEENANYLLLLAARTFFVGDLDLARRHMPLCRRLAEFIVRADSDGTGFPDTGPANSIEDASPALRYGKEQTCLAVKAQAAMWAMAELEGLLGGGGECKTERWKAFAAKGVKALDERAWLGDHFAVTLDRTTEGLIDPSTGEPLPEGELEGWDDYSIYTASGLLYLFLANVKMPRWKLARFARDIEGAELATRTCYGGAQTAGGDNAVCFSQNLWRDYVAAYLSIDMLSNVEAYWDYQVLMGDNLDSSLYCDRTSRDGLNFHPHGATLFGAAMSAAGLRLNRVKRELHLSPVRTTLRLPLLPLADWRNMRVPWLIVYCREGVAIAQVTERELLDGFAVHLTGAELEMT